MPRPHTSAAAQLLHIFVLLLALSALPPASLAKTAKLCHRISPDGVESPVPVLIRRSADARLRWVRICEGGYLVFGVIFRFDPRASRHDAHVRAFFDRMVDIGGEKIRFVDVSRGVVTDVRKTPGGRVELDHVLIPSLKEEGAVWVDDKDMIFRTVRRTFKEPSIDGYRLDWCRDWGRHCGLPAASVFCRDMGYERAVDVAIDHDIGARDPTETIGSGDVCDQAFCDGFKYITCLGRKGVPKPRRVRKRAAGDDGACRKMPPRQVRSAALPLIRRSSSVILRWTELCEGDMPVFGVIFRFDPLRKDNPLVRDFFRRLIQADGQGALQFVDVSRGLVLHVRQLATGELVFDHVFDASLKEPLPSAGARNRVAASPPQNGAGAAAGNQWQDAGNKLRNRPPQGTGTGKAPAVVRDPVIFSSWQGERKTMLFNGSLGRYFLPFNAHGGDFKKHARLQDGMLIVNAPPGSGLANAGIYSVRPVVWLEKFSEGAQTRLIFDFDPARTTGFIIALQPSMGRNGANPCWPCIMLSWIRRKEGGSTIAIVRDTKKLVKKTVQSLPAGRVSLTLTPGGFRFSARGMPAEAARLFSWNKLQDNAGFRLYVFSRAQKKGAAAKMALRSITLEQKAGPPRPPASPAPGVAPLPVTILFAGEPGGLWEPATVNGPQFAKCGRFANGRLYASVKAKAFLWGKCGILSRRPLLKLDERLKRTVWRMVVKVSPAETSGFQVMFSGYHQAAMWNGKAAAVAFIKARQGKDAGNYILSVHGSHAVYDNWRRAIPLRWVQEHWDGRLVIRIGPDWIEAGIPGGPAVRGFYYPGAMSSAFMTVYAHPGDMRGGGRMVLERITGGWETPPGMTRMQRWLLTGKDQFDPAGWLKDLKNEVSGRFGKIKTGNRQAH